MSITPFPIPPPIRCGQLTMRFGERVYLMGILNVTPDSFSDGGKYFDRQRAIDHALGMVEDGADLLDVGGESSRPGSDPVSLDEELRRVIPVIEAIRRFATPPVSVDTTKAVVAEQAIAAGAALINDISGLSFEPRMAEVACQTGVPIVLMHLRGTPKTMQANPIHYDDLVGEIREWLSVAIRRAEGAGIPASKIIIDPGIGFGKTPAHNLTILHRLSEFASLGRPLLVGPSRKAFVGAVLGNETNDRLHGTAAAVAAAVLGGAQILRVHDVKPMRQVMDVAHAILSERLGRASR